MRKIISFLNIKGGVAKTTSCVNIGTSLAMNGYSVLIVDMDKQVNATKYLNRYFPDNSSIYDVLIGEKSINDITIATIIPNLWIAPSNIKLSLFTDDTDNVIPLKEDVLAKKLIAADYDYILIDCPPALDILVTNALVASSDVLVPIKVDMFAIDGFSNLVNHINSIRNTYNHNLQFSGAFITLDRRKTVVSKQVKELLKGNLGDKLFDTTIRDNNPVVVSTFNQTPVVKYDRKCNASLDYINLSLEIIQKLN